jgi:ribonuclease E
VAPADQNAAQVSAIQPEATGDDSEEGDDEQDDQNGEQRTDQANGERRPRRRGRRGGRRRRGGNETGSTEGALPGEGIVSTIADDFGPPPESESAEAVADLSAPAEPVREEPPAPAPQTEPVSHHISTPEDVESAPRKRSTVREKVSFFFGETPKLEPEAEPTPVQTPASSSEPAPSEQPSEPVQPRRAGWWSRRGE